MSGPAIWNRPVSLLFSYRTNATQNALAIWLSFLPGLYVGIFMYIFPKILTSYKTSIVYATILQAVMNVPSAIIFAHQASLIQDVPMSIGFCTLLRMIAFATSNVGTVVPPTIAMTRYFTIIYARSFSVLRTILLNLALSIPVFLWVLVTMLAGSPAPNDVCSEWLVAPYSITVFSCCMLVITLAGLALNIRTHIFLRKHQKSMSVLGSSSDRAVSLGLMVQSIVPLFTTASGVALQMAYIAGIILPLGLFRILDMIIYGGVGINVFFSFIFVRAFHPSRLCGAKSAPTTRVTVNTSTI